MKQEPLEVLRELYPIEYTYDTRHSEEDHSH